MKRIEGGIQSSYKYYKEISEEKTMRLSYKEYILDGSVVDTVSADVQNYLNKLGAERQNVQRIRLTVEEVLLNILSHCGSGIKISVGLGKQFSRHMFRLRYEAEAFNPVKENENPLAADLIRSLGLSPAWNCRGKLNTVSLVLSNRQKRSTMFYILFAVIAAVILGLLGNVIPETVRLTITDSVMIPFSNCFLGVLGTFAGLMICLTICSGILGVGDSASIGRTGKSVIARFIGISFAVSALALLVSLPFVNLTFSSGGNGQASVFKQICQMFFDIFPTNIIDPFRTGITFHSIIIATIIGCAILALGERGKGIRGLINEFSVLFQQIVSSICGFVPLFVFSMLLQLIWSGKTRILLTVLKPMIMIAVIVIILVVIFLILSSIRLKCPPMLLLKKSLPAFLVAFTSASSMSAFQIGMETCEKKFGVDKNLASFIYPLGSVVFMPASVVYFTVISCNFAETYQVEVNVLWLIMAVVISTLIAISMPPIPGADIFCYSILFSGLGIPTDAIILATVIGIVIDYLDTGVNVLLLIFQIACDAKRLGNLDTKILLEKR